VTECPHCDDPHPVPVVVVADTPDGTDHYRRHVIHVTSPTTYVLLDEGTRRWHSDAQFWADEAVRRLHYYRWWEWLIPEPQQEREDT
jgi:hypothetical protein